MVSSQENPNVLHVTILIKDFGFPNGMASSLYVRLFALALIEQGVDVTVLCTRISEFPPDVENTQVKGEWNGVKFEYTTGVTTRSQHFVIRRLIEWRGLLVGIIRLIQLKITKNIDVIYSELGQKSPSTHHFVFTILANLLHIPITVDLQERTWQHTTETPIPFRWLSPLAGMQGAIAISDFLYNWAKKSTEHRRKSFHLIYLPILTDVNEQEYHSYPTGDPVLVYAAAPVYHQALLFTLDAMEIVWKKYPGCKLVITGYKQANRMKQKVERELHSRNIDDKVKLAGYLSRGELLETYLTAHALLIPLFNDVLSVARFPTKFGEYLASSRPVITCAIGEIKKFLAHAENGMLSAPEKEDFAANIGYILEDPKRADDMGKKGRIVAAQYFNYKNHGTAIRDFFEKAIH
jgi:glycosyltransferase involved in cell wall biosynthesis